MSYGTVYEKAREREKQLEKKLSVVQAQLNLVREIKEEVKSMHAIEVEAREKLWALSGGTQGRKPNWLVSKEFKERAKKKDNKKE